MAVVTNHLIMINWSILETQTRSEAGGGGAEPHPPSLAGGGGRVRGQTEPPTVREEVRQGQEQGVR